MELLKPKAPPPKKRPSLLVRFLAFLTTLALVAGAVFLVAHRDVWNLDSLWRWIRYLGVERSDTGQADSFPYEGGSTNRFALLDGELLVCSPTTIRLYSGSGAVSLEKTVSMEQPVVDVNAGSALVYDAGGRELLVVSGAQEVFSLTLEEEESFLSARLSVGGYLAVTAQTSGYKGVVTVYDPSFQAVLRINLSSRFITDAAVSPDGSTMALLSLGLSGSSFDTHLEFYRLSRSEEDVEPDLTCSLGNDVILDMDWKSDGIWLVGESALSIYAADGALSGRYDYGGQYLKNYSLDGSGYAVLLLGKYRAGSGTTLLAVDAAGSAAASLSFDEQVLSLSAAGNYVAVLTAGNLQIYSQELNLYRTLETTQGARLVLQRADGSTMLINADTAHLYVPN